MYERITPNEQQKIAIESGVKWFFSKSKQVFVISGYAGTGKTTLVRWIMDACNISIKDGLYVTFVGKAALVLSQKGLPAKTIHSAIYDVTDEPKLDENGDRIYINGNLQTVRKFYKKEHLPENIKIIIVDEGSMVSDKLFKDLMSFKIPIIVLGDPCQLPPVNGISSCLMNPDVTLTEIMRQAEDNPIIYLSKLAREHRWNEIRFGSYGKKVFVIPKDEIMKKDEILKKSNAIICGFNRTRQELNYYIREKLFLRTSAEVVLNDKLICRENNWNVSLGRNIFLINGLIGFVKHIDYESSSHDKLIIDFQPEFIKNSCFENIDLDLYYLKLNHVERNSYRSKLNKFEYGYAITCHLAQGSEFNSVLLFNERFSRSNDDYSKWLYTAITRAVNMLIIAM